MFTNALLANGLHPERQQRPGFDASPVETTDAFPQMTLAHQDFLVLRGRALGLPSGYAFQSVLSRRMWRTGSDPQAPVEPARIAISATTEYGSVGLAVALPSRQRLAETWRKRTEEELLPPHATLKLNADPGSAVTLETILYDIWTQIETQEPWQRDALVAFRRLVYAVDKPDLPNGGHALTTTELHRAMDFLKSFWGAPDDRQQYPNPGDYLALIRRAEVIERDREAWPLPDGEYVVDEFRPASYGHKRDPEAGSGGLRDGFSWGDVVSGLRRIIHRSKDF